MLIETNPKLGYNDITIIPAEVSRVSHRNDCIPYNNEGYLPIFTAPMSCVVDNYNYKIFELNKIYSIIPRNINLNKRIELLEDNCWVAFSLKEFNELFISSDDYKYGKYKVCIDIANGHMKCLLDSVSIAKTKNPDLIIMTGNIANPATISHYIKAGVDYVRLGIGSGSGCITSSNTGVHYPMASLIDNAVQVKRSSLAQSGKGITIIADGGIRNYNDVIKALALGADYVMIGGLFAQMKEACGEVTTINEKDYRKFYGMASAKGQMDINGVKDKTSEGIERMFEIKYMLPQWVNNMESYLRSAMSYCDAFSLKDFKNYTKCTIISSNSYNSINK